MKRRNYLLSVSASLSAGLAGCSTGEESSESENEDNSSPEGTLEADSTDKNGSSGGAEETVTATATSTGPAEFDYPVRGITNQYSNIVEVEEASWGGLGAGDYASAVVEFLNKTNHEQLINLQAIFYDDGGQKVGQNSQQRTVAPKPDSPLFVAYPDDLPRERPSFELKVQNVEEYNN